MFDLSYNLRGAGWARASFSDGTITIDAMVSYIHDSLRELARAARGMLRGLPEASFNLLDEPGGFRFRLRRAESQIEVSVERSRKLFVRPDPSDELVMETTCTVREFANLTINVLRKILDEHGEAGYREQWRNHDFPLAEYQELLELRRLLQRSDS